MGWRNGKSEVACYVDVNIDEFDTDDLIRALVDRGVIDEATADRIEAGDAVSPDDILGVLNRGDRREALVMIERYLGLRFIGRLT